MRILIVEDNDMNRDALSRYLLRKGAEVLVASTGTQGLELVRSSRPDVVLMDLGMPDVDGWECAKRLKADPLTRPVPIIALTAHATTGDRQKALEAGCDDFDTKPIDVARLLSKIHRLAGDRV